ncbi:neuroblast differentiation-associated protein AHNAK [Pimephales promelas]|nr:neuroblast differentiation-associated protein AHNAK [Pimephales promelas]
MYSSSSDLPPFPREPLPRGLNQRTKLHLPGEGPRRTFLESVEWVLHQFGSPYTIGKIPPDPWAGCSSSAHLFGSTRGFTSTSSASVSHLSGSAQPLHQDSTMTSSPISSTVGLQFQERTSADTVHTRGQAKKQRILRWLTRRKQGKCFTHKVKEESPAAHTGNVYEGDQIVGATIYFDNMSSEETAELLKTLNRHKVGLKLQNRTGDKSPCRSPMGTLSWEGRGGLGGSSSDILLSGDDEDYKRIFTKKIKPRLKSEDLAEGVDVRTERHSSTSSDGCTVTTITRRITTYTVDMPGGTSQQIDSTSPEFKMQVLQHEQSEGDSSQIRLPHSNLVSSAHGGIKMGDISVGGPHITGSSVKHCSTGSITATSELDGSGREIAFNVSDTGLSGGKGQRMIERFGRTETSTGSSNLSGKVTMGSKVSGN